MADDDKPSAFNDARKGLALLFRAARTTIEKLPTKDLEEAVATSAREVGRALENVGKTIEREVFGKPSDRPHVRVEGDAPSPAGQQEAPTAGEPQRDEPKPPQV